MADDWIFPYDIRLKEKIELSARWRFDPGIWDHIVWRPCTIRILMVADSFLYFSDEDFGLSDLVGILRNEPFPFARFEITTAHRDAVSDARAGVGNPNVTRAIKSFRFDNAGHFPVGAYDQVWLFGAQRSRLVGGSWTSKLPDAEIRKLCEFMDAEGGVFATGDHEDLGAALNGFVPRVRAMRQWFYPSLGPNGEPLAPPFEGPGRVDTNRVGHDVGVQFDDQSDDVPQVIEPALYAARIGVFREATWPHPLLCGPHGRIEVLPDHPHESRCIIPDDLNASFSVAGYGITEFPPSTSGAARPEPEIVATARVIGGHGTTGKTGVTVAETFGAIGAYDGHRAGVGRIVVDSTWHHFINVNLTGASTSLYPKTVGFLATAAGVSAYEQVKAYFRNIALWMSPSGKVSCMRNWVLITVINTHRLHEVYDPFVTLDRAKLWDFIVLGRHARDAIGKYASQCQELRWTIDIFQDFIEVAPLWVDPGDPWAPHAPMGIEGESPDWFDLDWMRDAAIGGAVMAMREALFPLKKSFPKDIDERLEELTRVGAAAGIRVAFEHFRRGMAQLETFGVKGVDKGKRRKSSK